MGLARAAGLPVLVVGDINPGGVFAALFGTLALLSPEDQALVCGFVVNKFRGDVTLLEPGLARADAEGLPCYLESSNPLNVGLYERHGFEVTREHHLPDGPLLTYMWRRAG